MCKFFSGVVIDKGKKLLWHPDIDSHTELLEKFGLNDEKTDPNFVRIEFTPPNGNVFNHDFSKWNFKTDQDFKPDWYDEDEAKDIALNEVKKLIDERFVINRTIDEIKDGRWWVKDGVVKLFSGGTLQDFWGGSLQEFWGGTLQDFWGGTLQNFRGGTLQEFRGGTLQNFSGGTLQNFRGGTLHNFKKDGTGILRKLSENKIIVANPDIKLELYKK